MVTNTDPTELRLEGIGVPPYSARGLSQTLEPIDQAKQLERTINGELLDLGYAPMRKYKSTISGSDQKAPAVDGIWPGQIVWVDCIAQLCHSNTVATFGREPVDYDDIHEIQGFIYYRPRLHMMVTGYSTDEDEWGAVVGWKIDLEEI